MYVEDYNFKISSRKHRYDTNDSSIRYLVDNSIPVIVVETSSDFITVVNLKTFEKESFTPKSFKENAIPCPIRANGRSNGVPLTVFVKDDSDYLRSLEHCSRVDTPDLEKNPVLAVAMEAKQPSIQPLDLVRVNNYLHEVIDIVPSKAISDWEPVVNLDMPELSVGKMAKLRDPISEYGIHKWTIALFWIPEHDIAGFKAKDIIIQLYDMETKITANISLIEFMKEYKVLTD